MSGHLAIWRNPADLDTVVGELELVSASDAVRAMDAVAEGFAAWSATSRDRRAAILERAAASLEDERERFAELITRENGKTLDEARAEVSAAILDARHQLGVARDLAETTTIDSPRGDVRSSVRREPVGPFLLVTPWNFPLATVARKLFPALALGNTAVVKASELTPFAAAAFFELLHRAGLPEGAARLVVGEGAAVVPPLLRHEKLRGVSFTGSTEVGLGIARAVAGLDVRTQLEMGGKNALVVLADADPAAALDAAVLAGFSCAGQWCTSTSRVIVEDAAHDRFVEALGERAGALVVGGGARPETQMGPVISAARRDAIVDALAAARSEGAELVCGAEAPERIDGRRGHWITPTVLAGVTEEMAVAREEVFGPVVSVLRAADADDALRLANATSYGLSFSVYTGDAEAAEKFVDGVEAGMCHVNLPTPYREPALPLGGWRASGHGVPECGDGAPELFTRLKSVYRGKP